MKYFYRKKNTPFNRRLFKTRKNSTVNAIKFLLIVSVIVAFVIPYSIYFSTGDFKSFEAHSVISLLWFVAIVVIIFPISVKNKKPLLAEELKEYKKKTLKRQGASNGSQCIKSKKTRIRLIKTSILSIIFLSFCVNTPVFQIHPFELKSFSISSEDAVFRTGESVSFSWDLMGTPEKAYIVFGDGNIEDIVDYCSQINGMTCGSLEHKYSLQGKYTPILKVYYPGKTFSKNLDVWIENGAPLFSFAFNGEQPNSEGTLRTSSSPFQAFEDEQVNLTITLSNQTNQEGLTYQFNFGDHQITSKENSTSYAWVNQGLYPVTITVIGSQGELSKQTKYVEVLNKAPQAAFEIINGFDFAVGKKIKFTAEGSSDSHSDEKNLRYVWDWGDGLMDYGKIASHAYNEAGIYNVTLYVKDDDSLVNQTSQIIEIENVKPEVFLDDYNLGNSTLTVKEGDAVLFTAINQDDDKAIFRLLFYWNFGSEEFDPSSLENFELGGWKNRHVFEDDFEGTVSVAVIDSHGEYDSDYSDIRVINVAPQISVFDANIFANVSFQVYRNDTSKEADFEFNLFRDDDFCGKNSQSFSGSEESLISSNDTTLGFSLLNQWKVIVNTTEVLPTNSSFQAFIKLVFVNGQELVLSSNELFGGNYGKWEFNLSSEFFDQQNYSYKYPITVATQLFDPSIDDVQLSMSYQENKLLEISLSNALPISDSFTTQGIEYKVDVYEQDSKQFANITARKEVFSELFDNHSFPLKEELEVEIYPLIDIYDLLQNNLGLSDLSIIDCLSADNLLYVYAIDDDLGNDSLTIDFETKINVEMGNLTSFLNVLTSYFHGPTPFGKIGGFSNTAYEGERVKFVSKANDEDVSGMTFMWDFGDGNFVYSEHAEHAWRDAGEYNVTLAMADPFGNIYYDLKTITILPKAPEIVGPFAFQGTEGSTVTLDVEIYDTYKDANDLEYFWYDNKGNLASSDRKPVLLLNDGTYTYTLVVIDPSGQSSSKDIKVTIHSLSPEIYVSSYMYHGIEGDYRFNTDGKLELTAYGLDTLLDSEKLYFSWTIRNGKKIIRIGDGRYQHFSKVTFYCRKTTTYQGEVRVIDPEGNEKVATFQIVSVIDSSLDGIDDETEEMLKLSDGSSDTDGDGLTDTYEMTVSNTSYLDPDTDGDLLWDGQTVNGSVGEQAVSTDPLDWDCDNDFLSDGTEYFGWNITVACFENTTNFHVTSDPLDNDTDNDGLSDYEEYYAGSNPRQSDTDNDGLTDDIDPFPTKWDGDEDLLSDYEEILRGTNYNNSDSDQDGLKDGEEVYGWGIGFFTNPLDADSDHDHISDSAEIKNYLIKLQDEGFDDLDKKVNLSTPISLHFPHHFEQAVAAQISFGISFGEYGENATDSYGVGDEDVQNFEIIIVKADDGIILANFTTNSTRYFSQVVDVTGILNNVSLGLDYFGDYEIGIGIPDNVTKEGWYSGTYSFESEEDGAQGTDIDFIEYDYCSTNCYAKIVGEIDGHKKVLDAYDGNSGGRSSFYHYFDEVSSSGTVEFWVRTTDKNKGLTLYFRELSGVDLLNFGVNDGYFWYNDLTYFASCASNTWYHIRIDFECTGGQYEGLAQYKFRIHVNGQSYGDYSFKNNRASMGRILFYQWWGDSSYHIYYDAFGFSWDPYYTVGDNTKESIDLDCYLEYFKLEFCRYLDPNDSDTDGDGILDGVEMGVLVEGNELLNFTDIYAYNNLTLNSIGNFSATYSFEDESDGTINTNIGFVDSVIADSDCVATVVDEFEYHNKVLELSDNNNGGKIYAYNTNFDRQNGTLEFWWAQTANNKDSIVYLYDEGTGIALSLYMRSNGQYSWYDGSYHDVKAYSANTWYHNKIIFNCSDGSNGKFTWYIDGESEASNIDFRDNCQSLDKLLLGTGTGSNGFDAYFDAIGFAWNWTYWEGENFEEQLPDDSGLGHHLGTYSFENEQDGTVTPQGFSTWTASDISYSVIGELQDHQKVYRAYDNSYGNDFRITQTFTAGAQTSGTIEWWWLNSDTSKGINLLLYDSSTWSIGVQLGSYFQHYTPSGWTNIQSCSSNTWYHVRIDFDCSVGTNGQYDLYIDGVKKVDNQEFRVSSSSLVKFQSSSSSFGYGYYGYYDAFGYSWDSNYEIGDNNCSQNVDLSNAEEYYLEIPQIGEVSDAQLDIEIESNGIPEGSGKVFVHLVKEETNLTRSDISLINYCGSFDSTQQFTYEKSIDLSPYVTSGQVYGTYYLKIQAFSTVSTDLFVLTKFEIETDTYVAAEFGDTEAWVTDPAKADSDGDGLSDYYEIFTGGTNPISVDTDGDDAWDNVDRDPLRDVMLEIQPLHGMYTNTLGYNPIWQIVINCSFVCEDYAIITPCEITTETNPHKAYFTDYRYYINIDDEEDVYDDEVLIPLELWEIKRHLGQNDIKKIDGDYYIDNLWYDFTDSSTQELWTVYNSYFVFVEITQIAVEKANTIAIYDVNSTFTGRYHDREQGFSIIQLQIPDDGHYFGSESFLEEQIGANSTNIAFVDDDDSDIESMVNIVEEVDGHTNVLCLQEGLSEHADITHNFGGSQATGTIEWWWRTSKISGGNSYFYLKNGNTEVIRLFMRDGKIKYHDGSYHDVMTANSNTWYRMKLVFACKIGAMEVYSFSLYVDGVLKVSDGTFYNNEHSINNLRLITRGDPFYSYFDAFGYSWDNNYDVGDNSQAYSVEGTPFEHGMNVIVIPTAMFTHTLLNGYVENGDLDQTPLYHPDKNMFEFSAIERDGQPTQANADADLMFYRRSISPSDAMEVLELVLKGLLNESWEEEDAIFIHSYICTKLNGTKATQMNLPYSVLGFIPWFNPYSNSKMGDEPIPSGGFDLFLWLLCLFNPILAENLHSQMAMSGGEFYKYLIGFTESILMNILTVLGNLLWLIVRASLLVLFYILLQFEFLAVSIFILSIGLPMVAISLFTDITASFEIYYPISYGEDYFIGCVKLETEEITVSMEFWVTWIYWEFFDLYIPWIIDKTMFGDVIIYNSKRPVIGGYSDTQTLNEESDNLIPLQAAPQNEVPSLNGGFDDLENGQYSFSATYYDPNFKTPDTSYGVKLHLINPNGSALAALDMVEQGSPDYTSIDGVNYTKTVDLSSYDDGLWNFFVSTKDKDTGEIIIFPDNDYLVGPDTSDGYNFLTGPHVTNDDGYYHSIEGWINDDFEFYVTWWDIVDGNASAEVNLCLIPAQVAIGTGVSRTVGVQKFEMQSVEAEPDYDDPVEYYCSINFSSEGYSNSEIGKFKYYFEAETTSGNYSFCLGADDESEIYFVGPLIKSTSLLNFKIESFATSGDGTTVTDDSSLTYEVHVSDYEGVGLSANPEISFTKGNQTEEFTMLNYRTSTDDKTKKYYFEVTTADLSTGYWEVNFSFEYEEEAYSLSSGIVLEENYIEKFLVQGSSFYGNTGLGIDVGLALMGTMPISLFSAILSLTIIMGGDARIITIGSVATLGITAASIFGYLFALTSSDNIGGLLGLSIAGLLTFIFLESFFTVDDGQLTISNIVVYLRELIFGHFKWAMAIQLLLGFLTPVIRMLFPDDTAVDAVLIILTDILAFFPAFIGLFISTYSFYLSVAITFFTIKPLIEDGFRFYLRCFNIYKKMIFFTTILCNFLFYLKLSMKGATAIGG